MFLGFVVISNSEDLCLSLLLENSVIITSNVTSVLPLFCTPQSLRSDLLELEIDLYYHSSLHFS